MLFQYLSMLAFATTAVGDSQVPALAVSERLNEDSFSRTKEIVGSYSKNRLEVLEGCQEFLDQLQSLSLSSELSEVEIDRILDAICFAAEKHQYQTRKSSGQMPYIIHPIGVANTLASLGKIRDADILIGALLHDTVEDTNTTFQEIRDRFGERVEGMVREVTDDKSLPKAERKQLQITNAHHKSPGAAQIKLSDKLYNLTDLAIAPPSDWTSERVDEYFLWSQRVVDELPEVNPALKEAVDQVIASQRATR